MTFIIAEIGSNWTTLDDCIYSIKEAKAAGADAAKFQMYTHKELYGFDGPPLFGELPKEWIPEFKRACDRVGIEFMCTAFSVRGFDYLDPYVKRHKVASSCNSTRSILDYLGTLNKPVYVSTGAASLEDIRLALDLLNGNGTPLYCVAAYPAKVIDFNVMSSIRMNLGCDVGYSDHSIDVLTLPKIAQQMGATVIEKHFSAIDADTPDKPHSINPREFKLMVDILRGRQHPVRVGWTPEEQPMADMYRNRCVAIKDLKAGEQLVIGDNFGVFRTKEKDVQGMSGFYSKAMEGKRMSVNVSRGTGISLSDLY